MVQYFHRLLPWARVRELEDEVSKLLARETQHISEKANLQSEVDRLKTENTEHIEREKTFRTLIPIDLGDPTPTDGPKYKSYVAAVAGLHKDILKPKFEYMISAAHTLLEKQGAQETDDMLRGTIYALRELIMWGETMINKQVANQNQTHDN